MRIEIFKTMFKKTPIHAKRFSMNQGSFLQKHLLRK